MSSGRLLQLSYSIWRYINLIDWLMDGWISIASMIDQSDPAFRNIGLRLITPPFYLFCVYFQIRLYRQVVPDGSHSAASPIQKIYITEQRIKTVLPSSRPSSLAEEPMASVDGKIRSTVHSSLTCENYTVRRHNAPSPSPSRLFCR